MRSFLSVAVFLSTLSCQLSAQISINEILASNRIVVVDEDGDTPDVLELYNSGTTVVDLGGYGLTEDTEEPHAWVFPTLLFPPGDFLVVFCSGKDRVVSAADLLGQTDAPIQISANLVGDSVEWRYLAGAPDSGAPPKNWSQAGFADEDWKPGSAPFGNSELSATRLPEGSGAVFLRHEFHVSNAAAIDNLIMSMSYNDGVVVFLNGKRVLTVNADLDLDQEPTFATTALAVHDDPQTERFDLGSHTGLLQTGPNVLGLVLLKARPMDNDLSLALTLGSVQPILHTNFKLSSGGETVFLTDQAGNSVDVVEFGPQTPNRPFGRFPDGTGKFQYMVFATPLQPNDRHVSPERIPENLIRFEPDHGMYTTIPLEIELKLDVPLEGLEIRYTKGGNTPTADSDLYDGPISTRRDVVIRAAAFLDGRAATKNVSRTYYGLGGRSRNLRMPVISFSLDPQDFRNIHLTMDGQGREYEREAHMEIFDVEGNPRVSTGFGLRLHGGAGRRGDFRTKKSYRAYFRRSYGAPRLRYPLIPESEVAEFDKLVFRSGFNDSFRLGGGYIRDEVVRRLQSDMGHVSSRGTWYNLFVNTEYRGIYNVVERIDGPMLSSHFSDHGGSWNVVKTHEDVQEGDGQSWFALKQSLSRQDLLDDAVYEQATTLIDLENFTDYMILNIWVQNRDWPQNNWYAASPRPNGKWRFFSWDAEFALGLNPARFDIDTFTEAAQTGTALSVLFRGLLRNRNYQRFFLEQFERHVAGALAEENVLEAIERERQAVGPDMAAESSLFPATTVQVWSGHVNFMKQFVMKRTPLIRDHIIASQRFLTLPVATSVTPRSTETGTVVTLRGHRFTELTEVFFGDTASPEVEFVTSNELRAAVPFDPAIEGSPNLTLTDPEGGTWVGQDLLEVTLRPPGAFRRGDADGNGRENITDAVNILGYLFRPRQGPRCEDALDTDDSGKINLTDAVFLLGYLLRVNSTLLPAPLAACGPDPTEDGLQCIGPTACE